MKGQWIGSYTGSTGGRIIVNIDERELNFQGVAYLLPDDKTFPGTVAYFRTLNKDAQFQFRTDFIQSIDPTSGYLARWDKIKLHYPQIADFSKYTDVTGSWGLLSLTLSWRSDCVLPRSEAEKPSNLVAKEIDWETFKDYVATLEPRRNLFRGQKERRRLRTSFSSYGESRSREVFARGHSSSSQTSQRNTSSTSKSEMNSELF